MSWVRNLKRDYGDFLLDIPAWEILDRGVSVLFGPSGSGKTTVFRMLIGLDVPEAGFSWRFGDVDLARLATPDRKLGVVFQSFELFPHMSAAENIRFAAEARARPRRETDLHLQDLAETLGLQNLLGRRASVLSGGEKQRVALARALISRPRVLLLDEPFSALDADLRVEARSLVRRALDHEGIPSVLVTHDRDDIQAFEGKVSEIAAGRIIKERPIDRHS